MTILIEATLRVDFATQAANRYPAIPVEVPAGADSFEVFLEGADGVDGLVIDLGCEAPNRWCGWSGGSRRHFVVGQNDATPGYLPGIEPGTWHVILGIHTVPPQGAELTVRVVSPAWNAADHGPLAEPIQRTVRGSDRGLPAPAGLTWYAGDLHAHSLHSDGDLSLSQLANEAVASGLDYLAVTEHNTTSHHAHLAALGQRHGIALLPGQEITTHRGHANAYGRIGFIDFRLPGQEWVDETARRGGFISVNHPVDADCAWLHRLEHTPGGAELWHGSWYRDMHFNGPLAWFEGWDRRAVLLGGGDFHNYSTPLRPGMPTTWIAAEECSEEALLEGLAAGLTTITSAAVIGPDGAARPILHGSPALIRQGEELHALDAAGLVLVSGVGEREFLVSASEPVAAPIENGPYRIEDSLRRTLALCR